MRYSEGELNSIQSILTGLENGDISQAVQELERLKEKIYDNIPDKQRQSRGITWVLLRISGLIIGAISSESELKTTALTLNKKYRRK